MTAPSTAVPDQGTVGVQSATVIPPVSAIADVLILWGLDGWLTPPLRAVVPAAQPIIGTIRTITVAPASSGPAFKPLYEVLSSDLSGAFVVIAGATTVAGAVWGEILGTSAHERGALGVVVDGSTRDQPALLELGLATYGVDQCVVGPNGAGHAVAIDTTVDVAGVSIETTDHLVADATGLVRIPGAQLSAVLNAASRYAAAEELVLQALLAGEPLTSAYLHKKSVVDELRR